MRSGRWGLLTVYREIMDPLIADHGGRVANTAGDSILAEFPSAVDAVQCAVAVQERTRANQPGIDRTRMSHSGSGLGYMSAM